MSIKWVLKFESVLKRENYSSILQFLIFLYNFFTADDNLCWNHLVIFLGFKFKHKHLDEQNSDCFRTPAYWYRFDFG